jgi:microsomal dipeptidase-like Zn-dependent dipeptidase
MDRREFLRGSAVMGASLAGCGVLTSCDPEEYRALEGVRIVDAHAHPDQFCADSPGETDASSTLDGILGIGMVASSFAAIGDLVFLETGIPGAGEYESTKRQLARVQALAAAGEVTAVLSASDVPRSLRRGVAPGAILSIEGGDALTSDTVGADPYAVAAARLEEFRALGVRILTVVHYRNNGLGDIQSPRAGRDPGAPAGGLTPLGEAVVWAAQDLGIVLDAAHADASTLAGIAAVSRRPILDSHTGVNPTDDPTVCPRLRTWEEMEMIASTGGVVCSWPCAYEYGAVRRTTVADWAAEIAEMKLRLGAAHVGLGTNGGGGVPLPIDGYAGVQDLGLLAVALLDAGLSKRDLQGFFGGNVLRVLADCLA